MGNLFTFELWTQKVVKVEFQSLFASQLVRLSFAGSKYGEVTCLLAFVELEKEGNHQNTNWGKNIPNNRKSK